MTTTPHLGVTLLEQSQSQKEVTINEALGRIDAVLNNGAIDKDLATPPGSPATGDTYIVAASATGAWSGKSGQVAYFDQSWRFIVPQEGLMLWVQDEDAIYAYNGTSWSAATGGSGMSAATYDPAAIAQQVVGTTATQTLTNKTLTSPTINGGTISSITDLAVADGGTGASTAQEAMACLKGVYILAASAVASSVTGTTSETVLATINVPANAMGPNGILRVTTLWSHTSNANNKACRVRFSGTGGSLFMSANVTTSTPTTRDQRQIANRNATNSQVGAGVNIGGFGSMSGAAVTSAVDTTAATTVSISGILTNTGDTLTLESYLVELMVP